MIVVLTGGTGYVGQHVAARCLVQGWQVHLLTRSTSIVPSVLVGRVCRHDVDDSTAGLADILRRIGPDCVLHLASAPAGPHTAANVNQLVETNIRFPVLLLEAMRESGVRWIVNTGTFWQHFDDSIYWPADFYAATKEAFEKLLCHYTDQHGIRAVTLKLYDTYGEDDPRHRIVTSLVAAANTGTPLKLSAGEQILDLTHVEDVGTAFVRAVSLVRTLPDRGNETFFVSGERMALRDLATMVSDKSGGRLEALLGVRPYREREIMTPIAAGNRSLPGWTPTRRVADTIDAMLAGV